MPLDPLLTTVQAAAFLNISAGTLRTWRHQGRPDQPAYVKCGRAVKYAPGELARFVAARTTQPGSEARKDCDPGRQRRRPGPQ
jgi:hypothetical protein